MTTNFKRLAQLAAILTVGGALGLTALAAPTTHATATHAHATAGAHHARHHRHVQRHARHQARHQHRHHHQAAPHHLVTKTA